MVLIEVLKDLEEIDDECVLYVKRTNGKFTSESDTVILDLTEAEKSWKTYDVTKNKCPGYEYFLEVFLVNEIIEDLEPNESLESKCGRVIHYAEFDC